jgi:hypothetical protein
MTLWEIKSRGEGVGSQEGLISLAYIGSIPVPATFSGERIMDFYDWWPKRGYACIGLENVSGLDPLIRECLAIGIGCTNENKISPMNQASQPTVPKYG